MEQTHTSPLERPRTGRVLTGVTGALEKRTGIDRRWIRAGFVVSSLIAGLGVVAYAFATVAIRSEGEEHTPFQQWIVRFDRSASAFATLEGPSVGFGAVAAWTGASRYTFTISGSVSYTFAIAAAFVSAGYFPSA